MRSDRMKSLPWRVLMFLFLTVPLLYSEGTMDEIQPGTSFRLCIDNSGSSRLDAAPPSDQPGLTAFEIPCECLARLSGPPSQAGHSLNLRHFRSISEAWSESPGYRDRLAALTLDSRGTPCLSVRRFANMETARQVLQPLPGDWLIVRVGRGSLRARLADSDPFTQEVPLTGSRVAYCAPELSGPFRGDSRHFDDWILNRYPSGYYGVLVLERRQIIDHGPAPDPGMGRRPAVDIRRGDYYAFCRYSNGTVRLEAIGGDAAQATALISNRPGLWLLVELVDTVDMH